MVLVTMVTVSDEEEEEDDVSVTLPIVVVPPPSPSVIRIKSDPVTVIESSLGPSGPNAKGKSSFTASREHEGLSVV